MTEGMIDEKALEAAQRFCREHFGKHYTVRDAIEAYEAARRASMPADQVAIISNILHIMTPLGTSSTGKLNEIARMIAAALEPELDTTALDFVKAVASRIVTGDDAWRLANAILNRTAQPTKAPEGGA